LLFLVPIVFILILLAMDNPVRASLGVAVVALGVPVYWLVFRRGKLNLYASLSSGATEPNQQIPDD
jgi:hypothetical protein